MSSQQEKAVEFKRLHLSGAPLILFNAWDAGSVAAVSTQGAKAIALGSHGVANAHGYEDGESIPLELVLANATRCVNATGLPVSLDFETGYGSNPAMVKASVIRALQTGIIGINIEDQISGGDGLYEISEQVERLQAVRSAAHEFGVELFINARTDLFKNAQPANHNEDLLDSVLERAVAFARAGADGLFVPGINDEKLITRLSAESPLPVNTIWLPGMLDPTVMAKAGVSRVSYGPGPYLQMIEWLKSEAKTALN